MNQNLHSTAGAELVQALPELTQPYALGAEEIASFRRDGHVYLRGLCSSEEISAYTPEIEAAARARNRETRPLAERDTYGKAFLQTLNLRQNSAAVIQFVTAKRFARVAAELMGVRAVRIFHEQALFKEPGGGRTPWHQDQYYWPLDTANTVGLWMPLVDVSAECGALLHASGSHRMGLLDQLNISDQSDEVFRKHIEAQGFPVVTNTMRAGDATFHYGWTLHAALPNNSKQMRKAMVVTYYDADARVGVPQNAHQENDRKVFLGGIAPGELANGPLNPVLYDANDAR